MPGIYLQCLVVDEGRRELRLVGQAVDDLLKLTAHGKKEKRGGPKMHCKKVIEGEQA